MRTNNGPIGIGVNSPQIDTGTMSLFEQTSSGPIGDFCARTKNNCGVNLPNTGPSQFATIAVEIQAATVIHSKTAQQIGDISRNFNRITQINPGLTHVELQPKPNFHLEHRAMESNNSKKVCYYVQPLNISLPFNWVKIWIANEININTCPYNAVLDHENNHVDLAHNVLKDYAKKLENKLNLAEIPTIDRPLEIRDSWTSFDAQSRKTQKKVERLFVRHYISKLQEIYTEISNVWRDLDSPEEYHNVRNRCPSEQWPL